MVGWSRARSKTNRARSPHCQFVHAAGRVVATLTHTPPGGACRYPSPWLPPCTAGCPVLANACMLQTLHGCRVTRDSVPAARSLTATKAPSARVAPRTRNSAIRYAIRQFQQRVRASPARRGRYTDQSATRVTWFRRGTRPVTFNGCRGSYCIAPPRHFYFSAPVSLGLAARCASRVE